MFQKIGRLFQIRTRFEASMIIYALGLGAVERGSSYLTLYPGFTGKVMFFACTASVFIGGAKILDCLRMEREQRAAQTDGD